MVLVSAAQKNFYTYHDPNNINSVIPSQTLFNNNHGTLSPADSNTQHMNSSAVKQNPMSKSSMNLTNQSEVRTRKLYDLPEFDGRPEHWPIFIASYRNSTGEFGYTNLENNFRIQKCVKGEARKAIESMVILKKQYSY